MEKRGRMGKEGDEKVRKSEEMLNEGEMHNGEWRNALAGTPRNKYAPFVLVRGSVGRRENGKRVAGGERRRPREYRGRKREWRRIAGGRIFHRRHRRRRRSFLSVAILVVVVFKMVETTGDVFTRHNPLPQTTAVAFSTVLRSLCTRRRDTNS